MLSPEQNQRLTEVGRSTPMGNLMRRYWHPIAAASQVEPGGRKSVRVLAESLILSRDPHGYVRLQTEDQADDYPVRQLGGLIFAYLGPDPVPLLPHYNVLAWKGVARETDAMVIPCNWLQVMENLMDPMHVECLHRDYFAYVLEHQSASQLQEFLSKYAPARMKKFAFDFFEDGIIERHITNTDRDQSWMTGTPTFFPTTSVLSHPKTGSIIFVLPIDDTHTWFLEQIANRPGAVAGSTDSNHFHEVSGIDCEGHFITNTANGQDYMVTVTQGDIAHRDHERLATSDLGILLYRQLLSREIDEMEQGHDPINVHRDGSENRIVELPRISDQGHKPQSARQLKRERHRQHDLRRQSAADQRDSSPEWLAATQAGPQTPTSRHYEVVLR